MRDSPDGVGTGDGHTCGPLLRLDLQQLRDDLDQPLRAPAQQTETETNAQALYNVVLACVSSPASFRRSATLLPPRVPTLNTPVSFKCFIVQVSG